jgi:hypothetical protein
MTTTNQQQNSSVGATLVGCYVDKMDRALPIWGPENLSVGGCASWAKSKGYTHFGMQYGTSCMSDTREKTAVPESSYARYGAAPCTTRAGYASGTGDSWLNAVYVVSPDCSPACAENETCGSAGSCVSKCIPACAAGQTCSNTGTCSSTSSAPAAVSSSSSTPPVTTASTTPVVCSAPNVRDAATNTCVYDCTRCKGLETCNKEKNDCRTKTIGEVCVIL